MTTPALIVLVGDGYTGVSVGFNTSVLLLVGLSELLEEELDSDELLVLLELFEVDESSEDFSDELNDSVLDDDSFVGNLESVDEGESELELISVGDVLPEALTSPESVKLI